MQIIFMVGQCLNRFQHMDLNGMKILTKRKSPSIYYEQGGFVRQGQSKGYIFDVDLLYPNHLWEKHNDYPLAPEPIKVDGVEKLISHLKPRKNYVIHYKNLKQYLNMGLKLEAVNRAYIF